MAKEKRALRFCTVRDVREAITTVANEVRRGELNTSQANAIGYCANIALQALKTEKESIFPELKIEWDI